MKRTTKAIFIFLAVLLAAAITGAFLMMCYVRNLAIDIAASM